MTTETDPDLSTMKGSPALRALVWEAVEDVLRRDPRASADAAARETFGRLTGALPPPEAADAPPIMDGLVTALAGGTLSDPPAAALEAGKRLVLNNLKAGLLATGQPTVEAVAGTVLPDGGDQATLLWRGRRASAATAALANATAIEALDFTETHIPTAVHVGAVIVPAVLAFAEATSLDGSALLRGVVAGVEVELALADAMMPTLYVRGFNPTGVCGAIGAAAGCAAAAGFDASQTRNALALAAGTAGGLFEAIGSGGWPYQAGHAARAGLVAAQLARAGVDCNDQLLDGHKGLVRAASDEAVDDARRVVATLGRRWRCQEASYKRYPTETITQGSLDAVARLRAQVPAESLAQVAILRLAVDPLVAHIAGERYERFGVPQNAEQAQFDLRFTVASAFRHGFDDPAELFQPDRLADPQVLGLRDRTQVRGDVTVRLEGAHAEALLLDGRTYRQEVEGWRGSVSNPATDAEMTERFLDAVAGRLPADVGAEVVAAVADLDGAADLSRLIAAVSDDRTG